MPHRFSTFAWRAHRSTRFAAALSGLLIVAARAPAEPAFQRDCNGPAPIWKLIDSDIEAAILSQGCVSEGARDASGSERIVAAAPAGESVLLRCPTQRIAVLPELQIRLWVKSNRPAAQLAVRIVLPRTLDPQNGAARTVIIRGATYHQPGHWQELMLTDVPKLLAAQIRVMRATPGAAIDPREAFVESVVLVIPGEPRGVEVLTDELEVDGIVLTEMEEIELASYAEVARSSAESNASTAGTVRLQGGLLLVDERLFLPRVIEWQGEPLSFLAERGFNVVQISGPPTDEQIADAQRHGLWFLSTAPRPETLARAGLGRRGDRILAWLLEDEALETDPSYARRWADLIRQRDAVAGRPVIIAPDIHGTAAGKSAEILALRHPRIGQLSPEEYDQWLEGRRHSARPGTPLWASFATQFGQAAAGQAAALAGTTRTTPIVDPNQLASLVRTACTRGIRGFIFHSDSSLSETDAATRRRAAALELINRRLQLIEPWLAGGSVIGRVASADAAWTGVVLHVDRARLLIPLPARPQPRSGETFSQATPPSSTEIAFLVPGVPESSGAYALSPGALRTLPAQRVAGGTRLVLPFSGDTLGLITEDPQVIQSLRQDVVRQGPQIVRLERDLIAQRSALLVDTARRLAQIGYHNDASARGAASTDALLRQLDAQLAAGRLEQASELGHAANRLLEQSGLEQRRGVGMPVAFDGNPLTLGDEHLAEYAAFQRSYDALRGGENLLYGGDFEDLGQLTQFGWRHFQRSQPGVESRVELSATQPKHGHYCLALHVAANTASQDSAIVGGPCVWVVSPPMPVDKGQIIEITGWVRIDGPLSGDGDGLQIIDSLGGPELSLAIRRTSEWQPFHMVRAVPEAAELRLTFALAALGSARVDAVMIRTLSRPHARRLPPAASLQSR